ncbi:adrenodoxin-like [Oncorhynchus clarkii lewisi]|uniref:adrenodoxin-like n=1 Tax=Oncorhynchus clarkii lewisi TaxID=490388 RepID=UPI0039B851D8
MTRQPTGRRCTIDRILSGCGQLHCPQPQGSPEGGVISPTHYRGHTACNQDIYSTQCHRKAKKIIKDLCHPSHSLFTSLPFRRCNGYFINRDRQKITTSCAKGNSFLDLVVDQNVYIDGFGVCEGTLACSICHVILDQKGYDHLGPIIDEENDMLDLAFGLTDMSRLGCQVCLSRDLE